MNLKIWTTLLLCSLLWYCNKPIPAPGYYSLSTEKVEQQIAIFDEVKIDSIDSDLLEWSIFIETNRQRKRLGILPLQFESRLWVGAKNHSQEMAELNYFDHNSPVLENSTIKKRLIKVGIKNGFGGENIAIHPLNKKSDVVFKPSDIKENEKYSCNKGPAYTYKNFAEDLVSRWLNSPPHRNNILNERFKFLGVGCIHGRFKNIDVFYVTQNFSSTNY